MPHRVGGWQTTDPEVVAEHYFLERGAAGD